LATLYAHPDVIIAVADDGPRVHRASAPELKVRLHEGTDWLGVEGGVALSGGERVELQALVDALREGRRYVVLERGDVVTIDDDVYAALGALAMFSRSGKRGLEVPSLAGAAVLDDVSVLAGADTQGWRLVHDRIEAAKDIDGVASVDVTATLRPYQQEGLRFLRRLAALGTGGVLADDMGLGKTLTTTCLLVDRRTLGPQIVVAPTSLGFHWAAEIKRFAPVLNPIVLSDLDGADARIAAIKSAGAGDVVITSYGLVTRDVDKLGATSFASLIVDEAQAAKNATTARARALRKIDAAFKLALTGTPLENHTGELWAIVDLVSPGLFGSYAQFKSRFADPIEKDHDDDRRRRLARALRPFLLRRKKADVASDLPPKIERTVLLSPSPEERQAYDRLRNAILIELEERGVLDLETGKKPKRREGEPVPTGQEARVHILSALTRLRLCACHPALVDDVLDPQTVPPGTKHEALVAEMLELREQGHHALVFSQFVKHLRLAERFLREAGLRTMILTGDTPTDERRRLVERFQAGEADVFLISLKAGGFGLNLTRASYVAHLDPWWNPAVENQASDRAHRIGQTLPVTITRLVMDETL
ncbi:MAG TPA: SNF2-related protein, partial [Myxococcota bacterium]